MAEPQEAALEASGVEQELDRAVSGVEGEPLQSTQKVAIKLLVSNAAAGVIIGRNGQNRAELQQVSDARIQLSRANTYYPGTTERILLISGTIKSVLTALYHVLLKISGADDAEGSEPRRVSTQLKVVMPAVVCGVLLGKNGQTIKSFSTDSGTNISISPQDRSRGLDYDRIITIAGGLDQLLRAVALILGKVADNPSYINSTNLAFAMPSAVGPSGSSFPGAMGLGPAGVGAGPGGMAGGGFGPSGVPGGYGSMMGSGGPMGGMAGGMGLAPPQQQLGLPSGGPPGGPPGQRVEVSMSVPDHQIGAIIGKGGEIVSGLKKLLNVRIVMSGRDEYEAGTTNRRVTISGSAEAVQMAQNILLQKLMAHAQFMQQRVRPPGGGGLEAQQQLQQGPPQFTLAGLPPQMQLQ